MSKKLLVSIFVFFTINLSLKANAENKKITIDELSKIVLENNTKINLEKEKLKLLEAEYYNASLIQNPSFMLEGSHAQLNYKLGIQNNIELGNKRNLRILEVDNKKTILENQIEQVKKEVLFNFKSSYYKLYNLKEKNKKFEELLKINNELLKIAEKKEIAGDIPKLDVTQIKLILLNLEMQKEKNNEEIELEEIVFDNIFDNKISAKNLELKIDNYKNCVTFGKYPFDKQVSLLTNQGLKNRIELLELNNKNKVFETQKQLAKENFIPNLNVYYGVDIFRDNNLKAGLFTNFGMEIPVFDLKLAPLKDIEAKVEINNYEKIAFEKNLTNEIKKAYKNYLSNLSFKINYEKNMLPVTEEIAKKSQISFSLGKTSIFSAINAQQTLVSQQLNYLNILNEYYNSIINLERLTGCI